MILIKKYIIDTNTLISSLLLKHSTSFKALEQAKTIGSIVFSEETFLEFELVLLRKKFDRYFSKEERLLIIEKLHLEAIFANPILNLNLCRDPKDDKFLNLALDINADCIITGDNDLLVLNPFQNIPILSVSDFLTSL